MTSSTLQHRPCSGMFAVSQMHVTMVHEVLRRETMAHLDDFHNLEKASCRRLQRRKRWGRLHYELQDGYEDCWARRLDEKSL